MELQKRLGKYSKPEILNNLLNEQYSDLTISIKSPNPKGHHHWGDYFFSKALKKSFEKKGFNVVIQEREDWYDDNVKADINLVLRGVVEYKPNYDEINLMWNISHPDMVEIEEYENYDICFISSEKYANLLNDKANTIIKPLLQCTDPDVFFNEEDDSVAEDILFVGVTRGVYRDIVKDALKTNHDVSIYGMGWEEFIDEKLIKGQFIENSELHKYYSSCKILLNDHWEDMRDMDFPSNRLFDALACGAFVISDKIPSAETLFEGNIVTYEDADDLENKIEYYLSNEHERKEKAQNGKKIVLKNHTFDNRVDTILDCLKNLN
ncbi:glycosyltransferase [Methanobrevibacter sp.]|uniref:CgeB family protein n=1 Tax=Methanobrevibacter sp. TaxID=66852 RepID=UPI003865D71F